jgi:MFS transporter, MHS family, alpha-ketoglutarate permease
MAGPAAGRKKMNEPIVSAPESSAGMHRRIFSIFGGSVGNLIEWYDFYVYSAFSLYFARAFFPGRDAVAAYLSAAMVFALGFLIRPIGGWLLGEYADRRGRRAALTLSVKLMCLGSLTIAVCPTYATAGTLAPALLVAARLLQGLSLGGEYGASATYLSEVAVAKHRGFYSSFQYVTLIMGQLLATVTLLVLQRFLLTTAELEAWGWRIPFVIGGALGIVGFYLRRNLDETESFRRLAERRTDRRPLAELLRYPRELVIVAGLTMGGTLAFYTYTVYMQKFLVTSAGLSRDQATTISAASLFIFMCLQPAFGAVSDRIGRRPLLIMFGVLGTLCTVPILTTLSQTHEPLIAFLLVMAALVIVSGYTSINAVVKAELFPARIRALGVALPYAITVSIFGGTAESLGLWLKSIGHERWFYWYVSACIFGSLLVYASMRETAARSEIDRD